MTGGHSPAKRCQVGSRTHSIKVRVLSAASLTRVGNLYTPLCRKLKPGGAYSKLHCIENTFPETSLMRIRNNGNLSGRLILR